MGRGGLWAVVMDNMDAVDVMDAARLGGAEGRRGRGSWVEGREAKKPEFVETFLTF